LDFHLEVDIGSEPQAPRKTEYQKRQPGDGRVPTVPLLSEDEQWALFAPDKHMERATLLITDYVLRVYEKQAKEKAGKEAKEGKSEDDAPVPIGTNAATGWPGVEDRTWVGLTNWIYRCHQVDPEFVKTMSNWKEDREESNAELIKRIEAWTPPEDFDYGPVSRIDPRQFYSGRPLGEIDMERIEKEEV
jgi:hypothetical protein